MRKFFIVLLLIGALVMGFIWKISHNVNIVRSIEYVCSLLQQEYDLDLTTSDVLSMNYEPKYSRDYACVAEIQLSDEYTSHLSAFIDDDVSWLRGGNTDKIIETYIDPSLSYFDNLPALRNCCTQENSFTKLLIHDNDLPELKFSLAVFNADNATLFFFTVK